MSILGKTIDDAAGEAFDKAAKMLGFSYPGGPLIDKFAQLGNPNKFTFSKPRIQGLDFSFSGLKTAVLTRLKDAERQGQADAQMRADLAAATELAIVDVLVAKAATALEQTGLTRLVVAGGVGANRLLRQSLAKRVSKRRAEVFFPPLDLCTDNGAMIAFAAAQRVQRGLADLSGQGHGFDVHPRWELSAL
jgi:N6-L-threonylcarbamoyladenine synthase